MFEHMENTLQYLTNDDVFRGNYYINDGGWLLYNMVLGCEYNITDGGWLLCNMVLGCEMILSKSLERIFVKHPGLKSRYIYI